MNYITEIFERANLQQLREFLLHGVENYSISKKTYHERILEASKPVYAMIETTFSDTKEIETIKNVVSNYASTMEEVYMEIGLQCGSAIAIQLFEHPHKK